MEVDTDQFPWEIRRNGKVCAHAASKTTAESIVRQLQKMHKDATFTVAYIGKSVSHMPDGGKTTKC